MFGLFGLCLAGFQRSYTRTSLGFLTAGMVVLKGKYWATRSPADGLRRPLPLSCWLPCGAFSGRRRPSAARTRRRRHGRGPDDATSSARAKARANGQSERGTGGHGGSQEGRSHAQGAEGQPLGVQLATIAVLVILGVGYFRLMSHSGRRAPAKKPAEEPAATAAAGNGKQPDGA